MNKYLDILKQNVQNQNLIKHCLAVEAVMKALARKFNQDEEKWAIAGLLHDIDYEETKNNPSQHSLIGSKMLEDLGLDNEIVESVKTHNEMHGIEPKTLMAKALLPTDPLTGLIVASTLVLPSKKIADVSAENILNRYKEKSFAKGANREIIAKCSAIDLSLEEFISIGLEAMKNISTDLGL